MPVSYTHLDVYKRQALIPHSPASPSMVAYVAMEKIGMAMPYYRQEFLMNQLGFTPPRDCLLYTSRCV